MKPKENERTISTKTNCQNEYHDSDSMQRVAASLPIPQRREFSASAQAVWGVLADVKPRKKRRREK